MKAALFCLLLVAGTQICQAYPTFGFIPGLGGGHGGVEKSVEDKVSHGEPSDVPSIPSEVPGVGSGGAPCADGLGAVPVPGPGGAFDSAVNTVEDTVHHAGNAAKHAYSFDIHGTSQEVLNGSDRAAVGAADIINRGIPGLGTAALAAYAVPSGIAHVAATGVSGAAIVASAGILGPKHC